MDTSPRQYKCEQDNNIKRLSKQILAIIAVGFVILVGQYSLWPTLQPSAAMPPHFSMEEPKATAWSNWSDSTTLKPIKNTVIVLWYWPFGGSVTLADNYCMDNYGIPNCDVVGNQSWFPKADLVVFHNRELVNGQRRLPLNLPRPKTQKWVWLSLESPPHNGNMRPLAGLFNYTMCYRRDSDIYAPYGWLVPSKAPNGTTVEDFIPKGKTALACWVVSNYQARHKRTQVYNKLKNVIPVDVYGGARNKRISADSLLPTVSRYYFYLSFENSIATDYITEKVWKNAFKGGAIPVVLGPSRKQYEAVLPKNSFIHVDDFSTVEELGIFMKALAADKERYASYFAWRLNYTVAGAGWVERLCRICPIISSLPTSKIYKDLHGWNWQ
ncbi:alpha-(1,3)-fucosyltransferase 7-like isoform X1 [Sardina pilchardus]|uniref:alpha-(1,3)-fucosyltransferase 7-like isoform X1 n=2 Tax=Sardina pilchardus TaxID=27697 RepID=UPI002E15568F